MILLMITVHVRVYVNDLHLIAYKTSNVDGLMISAVIKYRCERGWVEGSFWINMKYHAFYSMKGRQRYTAVQMTEVIARPRNV